MNYALAQANAAVMRGSLEDPIMQSMASQIDAINQLAEQHPGFIWRIKITPPGSLGPIREYLGTRNEDRIFFNLSLWDSMDALKRFTYESAHHEVLKNRDQWVPHCDRPTYVLWWIPNTEHPRIEEAALKLAHLRDQGPSQQAFDFKSAHPAPSLKD